MIDRYLACLILALILTFTAQTVTGQTRQIIVTTNDAIAQTGFWSYVLPRFSLKTGISVSLIAAEGGQISEMAADGAADVFIVEGVAAAKTMMTNGAGVTWRGIMYNGDPDAGTRNVIRYAAVLADPARRPGANEPHAEKFLAWLASEVGQRTIASFRQNETQVFFPGAAEEVRQSGPQLSGNTTLGEALAMKHCGRCHVVSEKNRFGGIDSTPSFPGLRTLADWRERMAVFWTLNPHPSFTQIKGVTEPFDPSHPPTIAPVELAVEEVENIAAFFATIKPRDLGPPLRSN